jgi:hypothetical protein
MMTILFSRGRTPGEQVITEGFRPRLNRFVAIERYTVRE